MFQTCSRAVRFPFEQCYSHFGILFEVPIVLELSSETHKTLIEQQEQGRSYAVPNVPWNENAFS